MVAIVRSTTFYPFPALCFPTIFQEVGFRMTLRDFTSSLISLFTSRRLAGLATLSALLGLTAIADAQSYKIPGNTPGFIKKAKDLGAVDPSTVISLTAWLKLHNENQLDKLAQQLNQKGSPNFHKWLTQAQFNASFSPTAQE